MFWLFRVRRLVYKYMAYCLPELIYTSFNSGWWHTFHRIRGYTSLTAPRHTVDLWQPRSLSSKREYRIVRMAFGKKNYPSKDSISLCSVSQPLVLAVLRTYPRAHCGFQIFPASHGADITSSRSCKMDVQELRNRYQSVTQTFVICIHLAGLVVADVISGRARMPPNCNVRISV